MPLPSSSGTELSFWILAIFGTVSFLLRVGMMVVGGFGEGDAGVDHSDAALDASHHSDALEDTEPSFKLLTLQSLTGFFMVFGWAGLAAHKQFGLGAGLSFLVAFLCGTAAMVSIASLFKLFAKLQSPGDVFNVAKTVGCSGTTYTRIPAQGRGEIHLSLGGVTRTVEAVSEAGTDIESFAEITVVRTIDGRTVSVKKRS